MARSHPETDSLLRITLEGQIQGKKAYGRPRTMLLDWLLKMLKYTSHWYRTFAKDDN